MMKFQQTGVGAVETRAAIRDTKGKGLLPVQVSVTGACTYRLQGRISPDAPWITLKDAQADPLLEAFSWVPYMRLEITSGDGTATMWIGEE